MLKNALILLSLTISRVLFHRGGIHHLSGMMFAHHLDQPTHHGFPKEFGRAALYP